MPANKPGVLTREEGLDFPLLDSLSQEYSPVHSIASELDFLSSALKPTNKSIFASTHPQGGDNEDL
jgi:hypothetical protein